MTWQWMAGTSAYVNSQQITCFDVFPIISMYSVLRILRYTGSYKSLRTKLLLFICVTACFIFLLAGYAGLFTPLPQKKPETFPYFRYPLEGDITEYISQLMSGLAPDVPPINLYRYPFVIPNLQKCRSFNATNPVIHLLLIVKSAVKNFSQRSAIRQTWGWEGRFPGTVIRRVFNLGLSMDNPLLQQKVEDENHENKDIIQSQFVDSYFNNTIKTMMGFQWAVENCANAEFVLWADDDMYVSMKNVFRFIRYPHDYSKIFVHGQLPESFDNANHRLRSSDVSADFVAGYTKQLDNPVRHNLSKWNILPSEYPFDNYPPFIPGGAFIMPFSTLRKMYFASMYTKHFRFDDVYLGIVASKAGIPCLHNEYFHFVKKTYSSHDYKMVVASHGYKNPTELIDVWNEQYKLRYA